MRAIDADRLLEERRIQTYYHLPNGDIAIPLIDIKNAPTIKPERKKGEWVKKISKKEKDKEYIGYTPYWYCPECGTRYEPAVANTIINYCYNCGTDMRGKQDE